MFRLLNTFDNFAKVNLNNYRYNKSKLQGRTILKYLWFETKTASVSYTSLKFFEFMTMVTFEKKGR